MMEKGLNDQEDGEARGTGGEMLSTGWPFVPSAAVLPVPSFCCPATSAANAASSSLPSAQASSSSARSSCPNVSSGSSLRLLLLGLLLPFWSDWAGMKVEEEVRWWLARKVGGGEVVDED